MQTAPLYLIECRNYFIEPDRERTFRSVVAGIVSGEWTDVVRVIEASESEGTCRDVTEDTAREVRDRILSEQLEYDWDMANWLHRVLGVSSIRWPRADQSALFWEAAE